MTRFLKIFAAMMIVAPIGLTFLAGLVLWPTFLNLGSVWQNGWLFFMLILLLTFLVYSEPDK